MRDYRFLASVGSSHGVLHMSLHGVEFIPDAVDRNGQLTMDLRGWAFAWDDVADIERVSTKRVQVRDTRSGALRIHYANYLRYVTVVVHEQLDPVFVALDELTHAA